MSSTAIVGWAPPTAPNHGGLSPSYSGPEPNDEFNRQLVENVRPANWQNPMPSGRYNLVVVGAGTAGLVSAAGAALLGAKVALVERHLMGGDCLNYGCVPSKALLSCGRAAAAVARAGEFGIEGAGAAQVDFGQVMQRMRQLRAQISPHDSALRFAGLGVDVFFGAARFVGPSSLEVSGQPLEFARAAIATGARAAAPPIPGLAEVGYLTNETVFSLTELPRRLAIVGAGPIGCELAQAFARFGCRVTLLEALRRILPRDDLDAAEQVARTLTRDGVTLNCCCKIIGATKDGGEKVLRVGCDGQTHELRVDEILMAVGRAPNVEGLNLDAAGVEYDTQAGVHVNDWLQTTNRRIYAAGDICSAFRFTHAADAMARIVIQNALFFGRKRMSRLVIPWCTYTDPEVAQVGLTAESAATQRVDIDTFTVALGLVDRPVLDGATEGFARVHVRKGTDQIVGATIVAPHAGDLIAPVTLAMTHRLGLSAFSNTIHCYPTQSEVLKRAADHYRRTRLSGRTASALRALLRWRR